MWISFNRELGVSELTAVSKRFELDIVTGYFYKDCVLFSLIFRPNCTLWATERPLIKVHWKRRSISLTAHSDVGSDLVQEPVSKARNRRQAGKLLHVRKVGDEVYHYPLDNLSAELYALQTCETDDALALHSGRIVGDKSHLQIGPTRRLSDKSFCRRQEKLVDWNVGPTGRSALSPTNRPVCGSALRVRVVYRFQFSSSALALLVGWQEWHPVCKVFRTSNIQRFFSGRPSGDPE